MPMTMSNYMLPRALYACQDWGPDMLQLSLCSLSSLQAELLFVYTHVLGLRNSVAQASLLDELGLRPIQIIWLKVCGKFFATACAASRGDTLLRKAMQAAVELLKGCDKAWYAKASLVSQVYWCMICNELDMCDPPDLEM
jgi:hypothetical protein